MVTVVLQLLLHAMSQECFTDFFDIVSYLRIVNLLDQYGKLMSLVPDISQQTYNSTNAQEQVSKNGVFMFHSQVESHIRK